jgi:hypothetical protein
VGKVINHLDMAAILLGAAGVLSWGSWRIGREFPTSRRLDEVYDEGWDASAVAHTAPVSTGRGAADDEIPATPPGSTMMCPGGRRCIRGPEPHQWSADCEEDEGWTDAFDASAELTRDYSEGWDEPDSKPARLPTADERAAMLAELAPETERPATDTEQFRAVFSRADGFERECLLTWDSARRYERSRAGDLREAGISEKRIRELLGAQPA